MNLEKQLIKGILCTLPTGIMFFIMLVMVVMTPDTEAKINYHIFQLLELLLLSVFVYGSYILIDLQKRLRKLQENEMSI